MFYCSVSGSIGVAADFTMLNWLRTMESNGSDPLSTAVIAGRLCPRRESLPGRFLLGKTMYHPAETIQSSAIRPEIVGGVV